MTRTEPPETKPVPKVQSNGRGGFGLVKKIVRFFGAFLLLLVSGWLAISVWIIHFPPKLDRHAPELARFLSSHSDFQVTLRGLSLKAGVALTVSGQGLTIARKGGAVPFLSADRVQLRFSPLNWFQGWHSIGLIVKGVKTEIRRKVDGTIWIGDWLSDTSFNHTGRHFSTDEWYLPARLPISHLSLRDARVTWLDEQWNGPDRVPEVVLERVNFSIFSRENGRIHLSGDGILPVAGKPVQARWKMEGEVMTDQRWSAGVTIESLDLKALKPWFDEEIAHIDLSSLFLLELSANGGVHDDDTRILWRLTGKKGQLTMPELFRHSLPIRKVTAKGMLFERPDTWDLEVERFDLVNAHATAKGGFKLLGLGADTPATIDMTTTIAGMSIEGAKQYFPVSLMNPTLVRWLDTSLNQGRLTPVEARIKGPLSEAMFEPAKKKRRKKTDAPVFHVEGDVTGLNLGYFPGLPPLKNIKSHLVFDGISMSARISSARLGKTKKISGNIAIPDMVDNPLLSVSARVPRVELGTLWSELIIHPKLRWDRAVGLENGGIRGEGAGNLKIRIPLLSPRSAHYSGRLDIRNGELSLPFLESPLQGLGGWLNFDRKQLTLTISKGSFNDLPLSGRFKVRNYRNRKKIHFTTRIDSILEEKRLSGWFSPLLGDRGRFIGKVPLKLTISNNPGKPRFNVKGEVDAKNLHIKGVMNWEKTAGKKGAILIKGVLNRKGRFKIDRAKVELGNLGLRGNGAWDMVKNKGTVHLASAHLGDSKGKATITQNNTLPSGLGDWDINADLEWLDLSGLWENPKVPAIPPPKPKSQQKWPRPRVNLDMTADFVILANGEEGRELRAKMLMEKHGVRVKSMKWRLGKGEVRLDGELMWPFEFGSGFYSGRMYMENGDVGRLLRSLDFHDGLIGGEGEMVLNLDGFVPPGGRFQDHLTGDGEFELRGGTIRRLGLLSTILGLFSLRDLPNLVVGDRPDLAAKGFRFDRFRGLFKLRESILTIDDRWEMSGPSMKIVTSGTMNFPEERLKLLVGIRPLQTLDKFIAEVPLLGKLVAGSRDAVLETQFDVTGSMAKPTVTIRPVASLVPGLVRDLLSSQSHVPEKKNGKKDKKREKRPDPVPR